MHLPRVRRHAAVAAYVLGLGKNSQESVPKSQILKVSGQVTAHVHLLNMHIFSEFSAEVSKVSA